ncbi:folate-binding protein YgfZ [Mesorhizobium soli]|uniref:CAF17-like 4Fe-4S cluster assembly/insertion protein YgfZ n=1 Tax=Pseudaminobacter soli (ex Li et al. 2025) TaxID=1295366 RepID=UPI0024757EB8|nr:folate-binding protein YgfZ [Mesorhizobium soli]MDH6229999.1 folate-binding protein YgfZ [Mesorhizobium soli]
MHSALLSDRTIISVTGAEAEHFLQNILTVDLDALAEGEAKPGALLTPQGKILFDFLISRDGSGGFRLDCRSDVADDFLRRLTLYKLRAKATISKQEQLLVAASWDSDSSGSASDSNASSDDSIVLRDARFKSPAAAFRIYGPVLSASDEVSAWHAYRISHGVAESGSDYALGDPFPHDVLLDETDGVGFRKGCYVGQEVVSRMQHRGTARRRVLLVSAESPLPESGTEILANGRSIGALGSVAGTQGLAIVRIDRVKDALDAGVAITAAEVPLSLSIPSWAKFTFPQEAAGAEEA